MFLVLENTTFQSIANEIWLIEDISLHSYYNRKEGRGEYISGHFVTDTVFMYTNIIGPIPRQASEAN